MNWTWPRTTNGRRTGRWPGAVAAIAVTLLLSPNVATAVPQDPSAASETSTAEANRRDIATAEAQRRDIATYAHSQGIGLAEATDLYGWHGAFADYVRDVREAHPGSVAGAGIEGDSKAGWIAFAAKAPEDVRASVRSMPKKIAIIENRGYSEEQLDEWVVQAHGAARKNADVMNVLSVGDNRAGRIDVQVQLRNGRIGSARQGLAAITEAIPASIRQRVAVRLTSEPDLRGGVEVNIYGGGLLWPPSGAYCTAGFNVYYPTGLKGTLTAAHCDNTQKYGNQVPMTFVREVTGDAQLWGDFQWHRATDYNSHTITPQFISKAGEQPRTVSAVGTPIQGLLICVFGQTTGQTCDRHLGAGNVCSGSYCRLAMMERHLTLGGDSGGPWHYGTAAYGVHHGWTPYAGAERALYSRVEHVPTALGVYLMTG